MQTRLLLISHAATAALRSGRFPTDDPLDARGLAQVAACRARMMSLAGEADAVFCSPAACARDTAEGLGFTAVPVEALADMNPGQWRGRRLADIASEEADALAAWAREADAAPPDGESFAAVRLRVGAWLDALELDHSSMAVAVTHAAVIRAAIVHALGASPESFARIEIAPLSVVELRCSIRGGWTWWAAQPQ